MPLYAHFPRLTKFRYCLYFCPEWHEYLIVLVAAAVTVADEGPAQDASDANEVPTADDFTNVENVTCEDGVAGDEWDAYNPCSDGSLCMEGDLGVYCECYRSKFSGEEVKLAHTPIHSSRALI